MPAPRLLICGFRAFPAAPRNPAAATVEALDRAGWTPPGLRTSYLTLPVAWRGSAQAVEARLVDAPVDGILLVGVAVAAMAFRVETAARNSACATRLDQQGELWPTGPIVPAGPPQLSVSAPTQAMAEAIGAAGLPVALSSDAGDYLCNFTLYRLLHGPAASKVGFLHLPQVREYAKESAFGLADVTIAVQAAAGAFALSLPAWRP